MVMEVYNLLKDILVGDEDGMFRKIWKALIPSSVAACVWRFVLDRI